MFWLSLMLTFVVIGSVIVLYAKSFEWRRNNQHLGYPPPEDFWAALKKEDYEWLLSHHLYIREDVRNLLDREFKMGRYLPQKPSDPNSCKHEGTCTHSWSAPEIPRRLMFR